MASVRESARDLVDRVYDDPEAVLSAATAIVGDPASGELERCLAMWAVGLARRELGEAVAASDALEDARQRAVSLGDDQAAARIATTMALTLTHLGRPDDAMALLERAAPHVTGTDLGHLLLQRGLVHFYREEVPQAIDDMFEALSSFSSASDDLAVARTHLNLGVVLGAADQHRLALEHAETSLSHAELLDHQLLTAQAGHNVGYASYRLGDIPRALDAMTRAEREFESSGSSEATRAVVLQDLSQVLLDANLTEEACDAADRSLRLSERGSNALMIAETALLGAQCHLRNGALELAVERAERAREVFASSGRSTWCVLADLIGLQATAALGDAGEVDAELAESVALRLAASRWHAEAAAAAVLAAEALVSCGQTDRAITVLDRCRLRAPGPMAVERSGAAVVRATYHLLSGDTASARRAITRGLALLLENHAAVGALELRALGVAHGAALTQMGIELAVADRRPRELLERSEMGRGVMALFPRALPSVDPDEQQLVTRLRTLTRDRYGDPDQDPDVLRENAREIARLEGELRRRTRTTFGVAGDVAPDVAGALDELGDGHLLEFVDVGEQLAVVHARRNRTRYTLTSTTELGEQLDSLEQTIARLQRGRLSSASLDAAMATMEHIGSWLGRRFVPAPVADSENPVVIAPTGRLHRVPWGIVPALRGRAVTVAPTLLSWSVAGARRRDGVRAGFIAGPDLAFADVEVAAAARAVGSADVLAGPASTVAGALEQLARVDVAHFACHGRFRADSPLFSSLRLADGDLTYYDLERVERMPTTIVMSACNAGQNSELPGGALLGMASALLQLGVSSVIAPLTPVNDERSVQLMVRLHRALAAGVAPSEALAQSATDESGRLDPTAAPFVCFGS